MEIAVRILYVEVDSERTLLTTQRFASQGHEVDRVGTGEEALELVQRHDYDVVLLDLELPDSNGYDVVRRMRASNVNTPAVINSVPLHSDPRMEAFEVSVHGGTTKLTADNSLFARVQEVVRLSINPDTEPELRCGPLRVLLKSRQAEVSGKPLNLNRREFDILELLIGYKGIALTKEVLLHHLYRGEDEPEMRIIDVFIAKLRRRLVEAGAPDLIGTASGLGYMMSDPSDAKTVQTPEALPAEATLREYSDPETYIDELVGKIDKHVGKLNADLDRIIDRLSTAQAA